MTESGAHCHSVKPARDVTKWEGEALDETLISPERVNESESYRRHVPCIGEPAYRFPSSCRRFRPVPSSIEDRAI
jgi:hypothetical protein